MKALPLQWLVPRWLRRHDKRMKESEQLRHDLKGEQNLMAGRLEIATGILFQRQKELYDPGGQLVGDPGGRRVSDDAADARRGDPGKTPPPAVGA